MGFWIFLMISNLLIPVIMLLFGLKFRKHGPKKINGIYGYRTAMSMKNKDTWEFAHQYCGALWVKTGTLLILISMFISIMALRFDEDGQGILSLILVIIQTIVLIASIFPVEKALKNSFDENGKRRI